MLFFKHFRKSLLTEAELLTEYRRAGDLEILGLLYNPVMEMVYSIAYKYLKDEEASKDAVMAIFEQLIQDLKKHEVANFRSWLHTLTRNYCLMSLRKQKEDGFEDFQTFENQADSSPNDDFETDLKLNHLDDCLQSLTEPQKICVQLFFIESLSYKEIVLKTGFDELKVKSYIQNGKRNLKICIEKKNGL